MKKNGEQIQILQDSSQEEKIRLKEEHSEINFSIHREEKDKLHKPEQNQLSVQKEKQNEGNQVFTEIADQSPQILQQENQLDDDDDIDEISENEHPKNIQILSQYNEIKPNNLKQLENIKIDPIAVEPKLSSNLHLENQKSITDEISSFHSKDLQANSYQEKSEKKIDISSIKSKKLEDSLQKIEISSIHTKKSQVSSLKNQESNSSNPAEKIHFDSQKLATDEESLKGSESEFSHQHNHSIISKNSKSSGLSKSQAGSSVYIQPKALQPKTLHKKKSTDSNFSNSLDKSKDSSSQTDSKDSGGLQKLMNKLSYLPSKRKADEASQSSQASKSSINQVYSSSFSGTQKTILEKFGFLQNSSDLMKITGIQSNESVEQLADFSQVQEKKQLNKSSSGSNIEDEEIIPIVEGKKKLKQNSLEDKTSSHNQSGRKANKSRHSGSSQKSKSQSKSIPSKPVNLSFIKKERKKLKCYRLLFHDFRHDHFLQTYYLLIDFIRFMVLGLIISLCYKSGKSMVILIFILNLLYMCYIIAILPFKQAHVLVETVIVEGIANIQLVLMVFYYFVAGASYNQDTKLIFGWLIIIFNLIFIFAVCCCCLVEIIKIILDIIHVNLNESSSKSSSDFDTLIIEPFKSNKDSNNSGSGQGSRNGINNSQNSNNGKILTENLKKEIK